MVEAPPDAPPVTRRRRWPLRLLIAATLLGVILAGLWLYRATLVEQAGAIWLQRMGLGPAQIEIERLGLDAVRLGPSRFGRSGALSFRSAEATYDLAGLRAGRVETLTVDGLTLSGRIEDGTVQIDDLEELLRGQEGAASESPLSALPFKQLSLKDFRLSLAAPAGSMTVAGDATLTRAPDDGVRASLSAAVQSPQGPVRIDASGTVTQQGNGTVRIDAGLTASGDLAAVDGEVRADLQAVINPAGDIDGSVLVRDAALAHEAGGARGLNGEMRFQVADGRLAALTARLSAGPARIAGESIQDVTAELSFGAGGLAGFAEGVWDGGSGTVRLRSATPDPRGPAEIDAGGTLDPGWLMRRLGIAGEAAGDIGVTLAGSVAQPFALPSAFTPADIAALGQLGADLDLRLSSLSLPDLVQTGAATGRIRIETEGGGLRILLPDGIAVDAATVARDLLAQLPEQIGPLLAEPTRIELRQKPDSPAAILLLEKSEDGLAARLDLDLRLRSRALDLQAGASGSASLAEDLSVRRVAVSEVAVKFGQTQVAGWRASGTATLRDLAGTPEASAGDARVNLSVAAGPRDMPVFPSDILLTGRLTWQDGRIEFRPAEGSRLRLRPVTAGDIRTAGPLELTLLPGRDARIAYDGSGLAAALAVRPGAVTLKLGAGPGAAEARIAAQKVNLELASDGAVRVGLTGAQIELPAQAVRVRGLRGTLALAVNGRHKAELRADEVRHTAAAPAVIPLALELHAQGNDARSVLSGELADSARRMIVRIDGEHSLARGAGRAALTLQPITFLPTVLQPAALFPNAPGRLREVDGTIEGSGTLAWGPEGFQSGAVLSANLRRLLTFSAEVRDAVARIAFDSLAPPSTPPDQEAAFGHIHLGLPFSNGLVTFQLHPEGRVVGRVRDLSLFGGSIRTQPFEYDFRHGRMQFVLRVEDVDLEQFLAFAEYGELSATGKLHGTIPLVVEPQGVSIRNAVLTTGVDGGTLRYRPTDVAASLEATNESTNLLMKALQQFDYDSIRVEIDENPLTGMSLRILLRGSSPNVYEGYPIELNVNVTGALGDVLEQGLRTYQLPDEVGRRLQEQR